MNTSQYSQLMIEQTMEKIVREQMVQYLPMIDMLGTNRILSSPTTRKTVYLNRLSDAQAQLVGLGSTNMKIGSVTPEELKVSVNAYMIQLQESNLSDIKGLSDLTAQALTRFNQHYDKLMADALLSHPKTKKVTTDLPSDGVALAQSILSSVQSVMASTHGNIAGGGLKLVLSADLLPRLMIPSDSGVLGLPLLMDALAAWGVDAHSVSFRWTVRDSEVYISNSAYVDVYTYGSPQIYQSGRNSEKLYDYVQFLYSSVTPFVQESGALLVQNFTKSK